MGFMQRLVPVFYLLKNQQNFKSCVQPATFIFSSRASHGFRWLEPSKITVLDSFTRAAFSLTISGRILSNSPAAKIVVP